MTAVVVAGWLSCSFDYLEGIARRKEHPTFQEVEIVALFQSRGGVEVVRRELEAEIVDVGHDTLEAWPKWCVSSVVSWWGGCCVGLRSMCRGSRTSGLLSTRGCSVSRSQLGNTWRATGNIHRALQCFRKALSIKPTDPDVLLNMAVVLQNLRYLFDAETLIREAVHLHPRGVLHHFILGNILQLQGLDQEAIESYEHALELQPDFMYVELPRHARLAPRDV